MGQVAKPKRTWNVAPVLQIVQNVTENYRPCLTLLTGSMTLWVVVQKIYSKCTLSHALILLVTSQELKIQNIEYLQNGTNFYEIQKIIICPSDGTSYRFVAEVTFKNTVLVSWNFWNKNNCVLLISAFAKTNWESTNALIDLSKPYLYPIPSI